MNTQAYMRSPNLAVRKFKLYPSLGNNCLVSDGHRTSDISPVNFLASFMVILSPGNNGRHDTYVGELRIYAAPYLI